MVKYGFENKKVEISLKSSLINENHEQCNNVRGI